MCFSAELCVILRVKSMSLSPSHHDYAVMTLIASCASCICCVWMIAVYIRYRSPSLLGCAFNDLAAVIAALQCMNGLQRGVAAVVIVTRGSNAVQTVCNVSGTLDQLLSSAADVLMGCFFLYLGSSSARRRGRSWRTPYIVAALCAVTTTAVAWAVLQEVRMQFSLELGWCWLPAHLPPTTTHVSQAGWDFVRFCCAFVSPLFYLVAGGWALYSLVAMAGGGSLGEGSSLLSSVTSAAERCPSIITFRVLGLCVFPLIAFAFCIAARFDPSSPVANSTEFVDAAASFLVPLIGCVNALVFLATEKALCSLCAHCCCTVNGDFTEYAMMTHGDASNEGYSRGSLSHVSAMGFAAAVRAISCDSVPGGHRAALAPHVAEDLRDARQRIDERLTSRGPSPSATQSRSPTLS